MKNAEMHIAKENLGLLINEELYNVSETVRKKVKTEETISKLLIVSEPLSENSKKTLDKILNAISIPAEDVIITEEWPADYDKYKQVLIFGAHNNEEYKVLDYYEVNQLGGQQILRSKSIEALDKDKNEKLKLWSVLKSWYAV